tara:strand:- start:264 stop:665 length:402 start_codon:yes stop_codon:yes gene_type:complete
LFGKKAFFSTFLKAIFSLLYKGLALDKPDLTLVTGVTNLKAIPYVTVSFRTIKKRRSHCFGAYPCQVQQTYLLGGQEHAQRSFCHRILGSGHLLKTMGSQGQDRNPQAYLLFPKVCDEKGMYFPLYQTKEQVF